MLNDLIILRLPPFFAKDKWLYKGIHVNKDDIYGTRHLKTLFKVSSNDTRVLP